MSPSIFIKSKFAPSRPSCFDDASSPLLLSVSLSLSHTLTHTLLRGVSLFQGVNGIGFTGDQKRCTDGWIDEVKDDGRRRVMEMEVKRGRKDFVTGI